MASAQEVTLPVNKNDAPYRDTGTGTYPNPPSEVTYTNDVSAESTGSVDGPASETTFTQEIDLTPTGAYPNPPAEVTFSQFWPSPEAKTAAVTTEPKSEKKSAPAKRAAKKGS